jgi:hypothetical protein
MGVKEVLMVQTVEPTANSRINQHKYPMKLKVISWMIVFCGLWEAGDIAALFVPDFGHIQPFVWNHIITGIFLMITGVWAARTWNAGTAKTLHLLAAAAGVWLLIASFTLGNPMIAVGIWNDIFIGVIVLILGVWAALAAPRATR